MLRWASNLAECMGYESDKGMLHEREIYLYIYIWILWRGRMNECYARSQGYVKSIKLILFWYWGIFLDNRSIRNIYLSIGSQEVVVLLRWCLWKRKGDFQSRCRYSEGIRRPCWILIGKNHSSSSFCKGIHFNCKNILGVRLTIPWSPQVQKTQR